MGTQVTEGLWRVDCRTRDRPNVYLVDDGDCTLVDAGWPGDEETVRDGLADAGFEPGDVDRVLLAHYDPDQVTASTRRPCDRLPEFEHACPGHGPPLADGSERLSGAVD